MISGKVDDTQSFDRKVFALTFEHGKCPVSWREIFSMARHKLRELVSIIQCVGQWGKVPIDVNEKKFSFTFTIARTFSYLALHLFPTQQIILNVFHPS